MLWPKEIIMENGSESTLYFGTLYEQFAIQNMVKSNNEKSTSKQHY